MPPPTTRAPTFPMDIPGDFAPSQPLQKTYINLGPGTQGSFFSWAEQSHPFGVFWDREGEATSQDTALGLQLLLHRPI